MRVAAGDTADARRGRRAAWIAVQLRQAYDTGWLPPSVADRIARIRIDADTAAVILTLVTGSVLVDRHDRIEILGTADDIAVAEVIEAVRRRGWQTVLVEGDLDFRIATAKALLALEPPVRVEDSPLSAFEIAEIEDARAQPPLLEGELPAISYPPEGFEDSAEWNRVLAAAEDSLSPCLGLGGGNVL